MSQLEILRGRVHNHYQNPNTAPVVPGLDGQFIWDTTNKALYIHNGVLWILVGVTYDASVETTAGGVNFRLVGSDAEVQDIKFFSGANTSITRVDANTISVASSHPVVVAAASVNNSGRTYIQDITLDEFGHITAIASATETVINTTYTFAEGATNGAFDVTPSTGVTQSVPIHGLGSAAFVDTGTSEGTVPILGVGGKLDTNVLPSITISDTFVVNSEAEMLALTAESGDVAVRTDLSKSFILKASPASLLSNWQELLTPASPVQSVNGEVGAVILSAADVGAEPAFTKNTAFNKNFGTTAGTVAEGNHNHDAIYTKKYAATLSTSATSYTVTHNLNTQDVTVVVKEVASPYAIVYTDIELTTVNTITIRFATAPAAGAYRVVVIG